MHYYQFNIGDYASHTRHITLLEDLAYRRLLDEYYLHERPLNACLTPVARQIGMRDNEAEVEAVLTEFFTLTDEGWINKRADCEIGKFNAKLEQASKAGKASASKRAFNGRSTDVQPNNNHKPITNNQEPDKNISPTALQPNGSLVCPVEKLVDLYHEHMPENPRCRVINDKRRATIRQRWREASKLDIKPFGYENQSDGLEAWGKFFMVCADSDFLTGKTPGRNGAPPFIADIDFLLSPSGFVKTLENKYHREPA